MPPDQPTIDDMRLALQRQAQDTIQPTPQSEFEKAVGSLGGYIDAAGRFVNSAIEPIAQSHPVRSWLAENLVAAPLRNVGTAMQDWTGTERNITPKDPRYTPGPFYGGSSPTLNPHTWGPAMQTFRTDLRALDMATVAPTAVSAARKAALPVARAAGEALNARLLAGESLVPGLPASVAPNPLAFAVKPKGGNWPADEVESALHSIRSSGPMGTDPKTALKDFDAAYPKSSHPETLQMRDYLVRATAMNDWIDKKLTSYIKNELATPEDPLRELADKGVSHIPDLGRDWSVSKALETRRSSAEMPKEGYAKTSAGKDWESRSDFSVMPGSLKPYIEYNKLLGPNQRADLSNLKKALEKNPEARINELYGGSANYLQFDHLVDELRNAINPSSNLPNNLRLTPEKLQKVTVPQAVELVSKINDWRVLEAAKAEKAGMLENLKAASRVDVPDVKLSFVKEPGMRWSDIPETTSKEGRNLCTTIGKQGGWCTQGEDVAKSYGSGDSRLAALLDSEGRPHAQAKITKSQFTPFDRWYDKLSDDDYVKYAEEFVAKNPQFSGARVESPEWVQFLIKEKGAPKHESAPDITELKPVGNSFRSDRAKEYAKRDPDYKDKITESVMKFLNSGEWGMVNDLHQYNIVDRRDPVSIKEALVSNFGKEGDFYKRYDEIYNNPSAPRFINFSQMRDIVKSSEPSQHRMLQGFYRGYAGEGAPEGSNLFVTPQRAVGEHYAKKRAEQTGNEPHLEMVLADPFAGNPYGHAPAIRASEPTLFTQARKLTPEQVKGRTKLYAKGGIVRLAKDQDAMRYELMRNK